MALQVKVIRCGASAKQKLDHASLGSSKNVWQAITDAANTANKFPQAVLWSAIDANLPEKSSAVKVVVQAHCVDLLDLGALNEWKRLSKIVARGAHALFRAGAAGWDDQAVAYEPFETIRNRSEVVVTEAARGPWQEALVAHEQMLAAETFATLTPAQLGGLFLLTHTPDNWVKVTESFSYDYWWLRVLHLSLERNVDLKISDFALAGPRPQDRGEKALQMARRQLQTIVALKVAIFYKKRHGDAPQADHPRVTRHDLEQVKRKWLQRPQAQKKRPRTEGVADAVSAAMRSSSLQTLRPVREVLRRASEQRTTLLRRIAALDRTACIGIAWQRVIAERSAELRARLAEEISALSAAGKDDASVRARHAPDVAHRSTIVLARATASTTGLRLDPADSVWSSAHESIVKLVAVGAGSPARTAQTVYVRGADEFKRHFGTGNGGACGHRGVAGALRAEMESLATRLLALLAVEFRLRTSAATRCQVPLELHPDLALPDRLDGHGPTSPKPAPHIEAYRKAKKLEARIDYRLEGVFAAAVMRAVCHAIEAAFYGCLRIASSQCSAVVDGADTPRRRAAVAIVNRMLTVAACFDGLVPANADGDGVAIVAFDAGTQSLELLDLELVLVQQWPAARALADIAEECEGWLRNPRKLVPAEGDAPGPWWIACSPEGLAVAHERKQAALEALAWQPHAWWEAWPPTREQVTDADTTATAIKWGSRASPAFLGIEKPQQFLGVPPFHGFVV